MRTIGDLCRMLVAKIRVGSGVPLTGLKRYLSVAILNQPSWLIALWVHDNLITLKMMVILRTIQRTFLLSTLSTMFTGRTVSAVSVVITSRTRRGTFPVLRITGETAPLYFSRIGTENGSAPSPAEQVSRAPTSTNLTRTSTRTPGKTAAIRSRMMDESELVSRPIPSLLCPFRPLSLF